MATAGYRILNPLAARSVPPYGRLPPSFLMLLHYVDEGRIRSDVRPHADYTADTAAAVCPVLGVLQRTVGETVTGMVCQ